MEKLFESAGSDSIPVDYKSLLANKRGTWSLKNLGIDLEDERLSI